MTQDSLAPASTPPPEALNDPAPDPAETETGVDAGVAADPVYPPAAAETATRADDTAADDPAAAPGQVITPDEGADLPGTW